MKEADVPAESARSASIGALRVIFDSASQEAHVEALGARSPGHVRGRSQRCDSLRPHIVPVVEERECVRLKPLAVCVGTVPVVPCQICQRGRGHKELLLRALDAAVKLTGLHTERGLGVRG